MHCFNRKTNRTAFSTRTIFPLTNYKKLPSQIIRSLFKINSNGNQWNEIPYDNYVIYHIHQSTGTKHQIFVSSKSFEALEFENEKLFAHYNFLTGTPIHTESELPKTVIEQNMIHDIDIDDDNANIDQFYHSIINYEHVDEETFDINGQLSNDDKSIDRRFSQEIKKSNAVNKTSNSFDRSLPIPLITFPNTPPTLYTQRNQSQFTPPTSFSSASRTNSPQLKSHPEIHYSDIVHSRSNKQKEILTQSINKLIMSEEKAAVSEFNRRIAETQLEKIKQQNIDIHKHMQELINKNKESATLIQKLQDRVHQLENEIYNLKTKIGFEDVVQYFDNKPRYVNEYGWMMLKELFINSHHPPTHHRFSKETKELYWIINAQGANAYQTLKSLLPIPSYNTIHDAVFTNVLHNEKLLLDIHKIDQILKEYILEYQINTEFKATLSIDALCVTPISAKDLKNKFQEKSYSMKTAFMTQIAFKKEIIKKQKDDIVTKYEICTDMKKKEKYLKLINEFNMKIAPNTIDATMLNNVFIYYLQPHDPRLPCIPIHMFLHENGSASLIIRGLTTQITQILSRTSLLEVHSISTDGDSGHQELYKKSRLLLMLLSSTLSIKEIISTMPPHKFTLASADMLHYVKTMRSKLLSHKLSLFVTNTCKVFDLSLFTNIFGDFKEFTDTSHIGKMRDVYPIKLFSLKNLNILLKEWNNSAFQTKIQLETGILFFLPWTCWVNALTNRLFTPNARLFLLTLTFEFAKRFYNIGWSESNCHFIKVCEY